MSKLPPYEDLTSLEEDKRIDRIGFEVLQRSKTVGVLVDAIPGKAERYIAKVKEKFPSIVLVGRWNGPTKGAVTIKFGPPVHQK